MIKRRNLIDIAGNPILTGPTITGSTLAVPGITVIGGAADWVGTVFADLPTTFWRPTAAAGAGPSLQDVTQNNRPANPGTGTGGAMRLDLAPNVTPDGGCGVQLDGSTTYLTRNSSDTFSMADVWTVEILLKRNGGLGSRQTLISRNGNAQVSIVLDANNKIEVGVSNGTTPTVICTSTVALTDITAAHHIVVTKNGASTHIYLDSVDVTGAIADQTMATSILQILIGACAGPAQYFNGTIYGIVLTGGTAISAARVLAHYQSLSTTSPGVITGLDQYDQLLCRLYASSDLAGANADYMLQQDVSGLSSGPGLWDDLFRITHTAAATADYVFSIEMQPLIQPAAAVVTAGWQRHNLYEDPTAALTALQRRQMGPGKRLRLVARTLAGISAGASVVNLSIVSIMFGEAFW